MNDLSGEDAFDKVLEAALDAHHNARRAVDLQHAAEAMAAALERDADRAKEHAARLKQEKESGLPKLAELWQAAKAVSDYRTTFALKNPLEDASDIATLMKRLKVALDAAADHCDDIPF
jgi:hypothetical protein